MKLEDRYKKILLDIINKNVSDCRVYLFGSRARGKHRSGADFDLAIDAGKPLPINIILDIQTLIEETNIPVFVDLVDLNMASEELKNEVNREGVLWKI